LFSIPENHELYGRGTAYQAFLKANRPRARTPQQGSYFSVMFSRFTRIIIRALDVETGTVANDTGSPNFELGSRRS